MDIPMLLAYCDESYGSDIKTTPVYVVAGFIGQPKQWALFEKLWRTSMKELRISDIGCHAARCANGAEPYRHILGARRAEIQYRLIVDIAASKLYGCVSIIDMVAYRSYQKILTSLLEPDVRQYNEPHVLAVRQCVQQMCQVTEDVTEDPISFIVDRNDAFGRRAHDWYSASAKNTENVNKHAKRFGPYSSADRMSAPGLQAADLLAYAGFRHVNGGKAPWQWKTLKSGVLVNEFTSGEEFWAMLAKDFQATADAKGE
jgi:hypothetical protein